MPSKQRYEGYYLSDHRNSPGITPETAALAVPGNPLPPGAGKGVFESATYTCSHCPQVVILNPKRHRPRGYCRKCDKYICDRCNDILHTTGVCKTYKQQMDELQEANFLEELRNG